MLESYFNKVAGLKACNFIKKRLQHRCFSVNTVKFFRAPILKNICKRLLLYWIIYQLRELFIENKHKVCVIYGECQTQHLLYTSTRPNSTPSLRLWAKGWNVGDFIIIFNRNWKLSIAELLSFSNLFERKLTLLDFDGTQ